MRQHVDEFSMNFEALDDLMKSRIVKGSLSALRLVGFFLLNIDRGEAKVRFVIIG